MKVNYVVVPEKVIFQGQRTEAKRLTVLGKLLSINQSGASQTRLKGQQVASEKG